MANNTIPSSASQRSSSALDGRWKLNDLNSFNDTSTQLDGLRPFVL
jgi:hypothetical protein